MIEQFIPLIPQNTLRLSGKVFYAGRAAFSNRSKIYLLGVNPGGSPEGMQHETVESHTYDVLKKFPEKWSAYSDESWKGQPAGYSGMQPRVLHLARQLGMDIRMMPASNIVFPRSTRKITFVGNFRAMAEEAWPFHRHVIDVLDCKIIVCFGEVAGNWVARQLGANQYSGSFVEKNNRRWQILAASNSKGISVVTLTHPSVADWTNPASDPTHLVKALI